jgi:hypothetical protein
LSICKMVGFWSDNDAWDICNTSDLFLIWWDVEMDV